MLFILLSTVNPDETAIWKLYAAGDVVGIAGSMQALPDTLPSKLFFKALFEEDGVKASATFDAIVRKYPDTECAPLALERLAAIKATLGKADEAGKYRKLLKERYPDFKGQIDLDAISSLSKPSNPTPAVQPNRRESATMWTIQAGAFRNKSGAESVGKKVAAFGKVKYSEISGKKGKITIVTVGEFKEIKTAEETAARIRSKTGLDVVVVQADGK